MSSFVIMLFAYQCLWLSRVCPPEDDIQGTFFLIRFLRVSSKRCSQSFFLIIIPITLHLSKSTDEILSSANKII